MSNAAAKPKQQEEPQTYTVRKNHQANPARPNYYRQFERWSCRILRPYERAVIQNLEERRLGPRPVRILLHTHDDDQLIRPLLLEYFRYLTEEINPCGRVAIAAPRLGDLDALMRLSTENLIDQKRLQQPPRPRNPFIPLPPSRSRRRRPSSLRQNPAASFVSKRGFSRRASARRDGGQAVALPASLPSPAVSLARHEVECERKARNKKRKKEVEDPRPLPPGTALRPSASVYAALTEALGGARLKDFSEEELRRIRYEYFGGWPIPRRRRGRKLLQQFGYQKRCRSYPIARILGLSPRCPNKTRGQTYQSALLLDTHRYGHETRQANVGRPFRQQAIISVLKNIRGALPDAPGSMLVIHLDRTVHPRSVIQRLFRNPGRYFEALDLTKSLDKLMMRGEGELIYRKAKQRRLEQLARRPRRPREWGWPEEEHPLEWSDEYKVFYDPEIGPPESYLLCCMNDDQLRSYQLYLELNPNAEV